jgi:hypothetical protein
VLDRARSTGMQCRIGVGSVGSETSSAMHHIFASRDLQLGLRYSSERAVRTDEDKEACNLMTLARVEVMQRCPSQSINLTERPPNAPLYSQACHIWRGIVQKARRFLPHHHQPILSVYLNMKSQQPTN